MGGHMQTQVNGSFLLKYMHRLSNLICLNQC